MVQRFLASSGVSGETLAKMLIVQSQLSKRGAKGEHVAEVFRFSFLKII